MKTCEKLMNKSIQSETTKGSHVIKMGNANDRES